MLHAAACALNMCDFRDNHERLLSICLQGVAIDRDGGLHCPPLYQTARLV